MTQALPILNGRCEAMGTDVAAEHLSNSSHATIISVR